MSNILVVDDDDDIRELIVRKLRKRGHDVEAAANGEAALVDLRAARPDLVVLDWMMPGIDGLEVCRALRAMVGGDETFVVLLTAKAQEVDVQRGLAAGVDDYVVKPFSPGELADRVDAALARGRMGVAR